MSNLYSLAYISRNNIKGDVKQELQKILATAHRNNPRLGITGALLFSGGYFCQVIEGPQHALEELLEVIQMDKRHDQITVLQFESVEERSFSEWAMALAGIEDEAIFDIKGVLRSKEELKAHEAGRYIVNTLEKLVKQHQSILAES